MLADFRHRLVEALRARAATTAPRMGPATVAVLVYVALYVGVSLADGRPGNPYYQFTEGKGIDTMSAVFMAMASAFAWATFLLHPRERGRGHLFWLLTALAFLFFAVDEIRHYHERFGDWLLEDVGGAGPFRNWNDVLVLIYGAAGIALTAAFLPEVVRWRRFTGFLALGFLMYAVHTGIDGLVEGSNVKNVPEETAKLFATAFFALAMLAALLSVAAPGRRDRG